MRKQSRIQRIINFDSNIAAARTSLRLASQAIDPACASRHRDYASEAMVAAYLEWKEEKAAQSPELIPCANA